MTGYLEVCAMGYFNNPTQTFTVHTVIIIPFTLHEKRQMGAPFRILLIAGNLTVGPVQAS